MGRRVLVAGVGMVPFATPRKSEPYDLMGEKAARAALGDAGVDYAQIQQAYAGFVYGDSTCGQRAPNGVVLAHVAAVAVRRLQVSGQRLGVLLAEGAGERHRAELRAAFVRQMGSETVSASRCGNGKLASRSSSLKSTSPVSS